MFHRYFIDDDVIQKESEQILAESQTCHGVIDIIDGCAYTADLTFYQVQGVTKYDFVEFHTATQFLEPIQKFLECDNFLFKNLTADTYGYPNIDIKKLQKIADTLSNFHSIQSCKVKGLIKGRDNSQSHKEYLIPFPNSSNTEGFKPALYLLIHVAHALSTSKEPLEEERELWAPLIAKCVETLSWHPPEPTRNSLVSIFTDGAKVFLTSTWDVLIDSQRQALFVCDTLLLNAASFLREHFCRLANRPVPPIVPATACGLLASQLVPKGAMQPVLALAVAGAVQSMIERERARPMPTTRFNSAAEFDSDLEHQLNESWALVEGNLSSSDVDRLARGERITLERA